MKSAVLDDVETEKNGLQQSKDEVARALGQKVGEASMKPLVEALGTLQAGTAIWTCMNLPGHGV